ncbi:TonB-linked SusC/RagA family outer membrane protein [Flavobacterium sp. PL11]|jgi:TonB-linked SusC/RagA family outer membrane protein|uniref:SusC/RagA family TonB-linked outer membrane protein n=1 Tax=Flavobacterium sp. PL11 TaxID=3071717 RepID=UPI002DFEEB50|nr:TonB-linked SusC/RagA family outer membrane protein [Flavobacterium sp. PL11]
MKNNLIKYLAAVLVMLCTSVAYSQDVSGTVSDGSGPLPGASILVKGTNIGAQTDLDGKYTIKNVGQNAILIFSYIGLKTQEVNVAGRSNVNITLVEDSAELKEVVVIGYGTVRKKDATGAVDIISAKKFDNVAAVNPGSLLQGKVAGVQITSSSGEPGAGVSVRVRGNGTLRSGNGPLIVVDGVPLGGGDVSSGNGDIGLGTSSAKDPLSFINPNDIESMSILKDASSTAIYGARGANGVIIITTKKGKSGLPELSYSTSYQISNFSSKFDVLSPERFAELSPANNKNGSFKWKDAILQQGSTINHDLAYSSSTERSNTRVSLGLNNTDGIVRNTGLDKYTASLFNSNDFFNDKVKVETRLSYSNIKDQRGLITNNGGFIGNLISSSLYWNPTLNVYNNDGSYFFNGDSYLNPVQLLNSYSNKGDLSKFLGSLTTTVKLTNDLKYQLLVGIETSNSLTTTELLPTMIIQNVAVATNPADQKQYRGMATISSDQRTNKTIEHNLTYNKDITADININAIVGYSFYDYMSNGNFTLGKGYAPSQTNLIDNIEGGIPTEFRANSYKGQTQLQSVFGRASLAFYNRLNVDLTVRRDGSSKAGDGKKYGNFPSLGLGYKIFSGNEGLVNDFKIRLNVGKTGNTEFPRNSSVGVIQYNGPDSFNIVNNANPNLTWETSTSYGLGTDFTLINNKLSGSLDYFIKDTENLIVGVPSTSGQPSPQGIKFKNLDGNLINKGVDFGLNLNAINSEDLTWDISANMAFLSNEVKNLGSTNVFEAGNVDGQGLSGAFIQTIKDGSPLYAYELNQFKGYNTAGESEFINPDGSIVNSQNAKKVLTDKTPLPKTTVGFSTSVSYKQIDISTSLYGSFGHYIYNNTDNATFFKSAFGGKNSTETAATSAQSAADINGPSTKYLEKGDFLRLNNLTVGYTFKQGATLERFYIKSARFYVNGSNLFVITKYSGFDPEVDSDKSRNGIPSAGIDYYSYPKARTFALGLNVTF